MKKFLSTIAVVMAFVASVQAQGVLKFNKEVHDFGKVSEGPLATYSFEVTNTGNAPVVISNAAASCGCTTPEWPRDPIMPGAKSTIKVGYNTSGRPGAFTKTINVTSNAENGTVILTIKGEVTAPASPAAAPASSAKGKKKV
ncbi:MULTISPECIES: DUF1573 domain-containing protein [Emticicia]|uniref:DUF1573 domain-containing protein n=1 Tax=Emticicia TaxID=312278 RepID=UPI000C763B63|nr:MULTISPECIES: DUF1573 domain-containing protein [Emticicia]PLK42788.1 hypothetical protein C0V77_19860 [Emticicia sp. TH156]UTA67536.1 DUF1573 domain-containing protein [Emticicia sp. 21SJ11W-3]